MGSGLSALDNDGFGKKVAALGDAYTPYREICILNGIDGAAALGLGLGP